MSAAAIASSVVWIAESVSLCGGDGCPVGSVVSLRAFLRNVAEEVDEMEFPVDVADVLVGVANDVSSVVMSVLALLEEELAP